MTSRVAVAVLISGRGSNLHALLAAASRSSYAAEIRLVVANRADAAGLTIAADYGVEAVVVDQRRFSTRESHEQAIDTVLRARGVELVALAGYMRILSPWLVSRWRGRMLNIHPSLLPELRGLNTHRRALESGASRHGCSVHLVTEALDDGPVLAQEVVPILPTDSEEALARRVLEAEHRIYPPALERLAQELKGSARLEAASHSRATEGS